MYVNEVMMAQRNWRVVVEHAEALVAPQVRDSLSDAELLQRFAQQKDDACFSAIVQRHGPMVWGMCRHLTANESDAEDVYQASFLALFRHAHRIRNPQALGAWLHRVARHACRNSLRALARRKQHERLAAISERSNPITSETWDNWLKWVHREIDRLPEKLRVPFVMCILQGVPQAEAAERLGWKLGTLSGRISKAKQALTHALERQGLTGAAIATMMVGCGTFCEPLSARLTEKTLVSSFNGSGHCLSPVIQQLAHGATGGFMNQWKWFAMTTAAGLALMGAGGFYFSKADAQSKQPSNMAPFAQAKEQPKQPSNKEIPPAAEPSKFLKKLKGTYEVIVAKQRGEDEPDIGREAIKYTFKEDTMILSFTGIKKDLPDFEASFTLDENKDPHLIVIIPKTGGLAGKKMYGIIKAANDGVVTICLSDVDAATIHPKDFTSTKENKNILMVLKKMK